MKSDEILIKEQNYCKELADWAASIENIGDELARKRVINAFIDTIGCIYAGSNDIATLKVLGAAITLGGTSSSCSTVFGHDTYLAASEAAMVNGTAAHALDFDDNFIPAVTHASAVLVPALLALGQERSASGRELIDAYIIGLEVQSLIGKLINPKHYGKGWHATSTIGSVGAAAACGRLLGLSKEKMLYAMSISTSMAGGSKKQFGTMTKPLHAGLAARSGITSARLAEHGVEADSSPFVGAWGFFDLFANVDYEFGVLPSENSDLAIFTDGLAVKRFPCCASAHRTLDSIIKLMERNSINHQDIVSIETTIPETNYNNLRFNDPVNEIEARFSMHYCAAVAAYQGLVSVRDFEIGSLKRPEIKILMKKVLMFKHNVELENGASIWDQPAITKIIVSDGKVYKDVSYAPVGTISKPFSEEDVRIKFNDCCKEIIPEHKVSELYNKLILMDEIDNISNIKFK